ncbi:hypothetical protein [Serratia quinivorans]
MSRVNWEEGLALFAEAWRRTGISPEIWCGENGYSWGSAKRHITIKAAKKHLEEKGENSPKQTAKKAANSQKKTANKTANSQVAKQVKKTSASDKRESISEPVKLIERDVETDFEPAEFGLSEQQEIFVVEYLRTQDKYAAYKKAKYKCEGDTGKAAARRMYRFTEPFAQGLKHVKNATMLSWMKSFINWFPLLKPTRMTWCNFVVSIAVIAGVKTTSTSGGILTNN